MEDEKIARWWNSVKDEDCWPPGVRGFKWEVLAANFNQDYLESIRNVYRKARRMV